MFDELFNEKKEQKMPTINDLLQVKSDIIKIKELEKLYEQMSKGKFSEEEFMRRIEELKNKKIEVDLQPELFRPLNGLIFPHCCN